VGARRVGHRVELLVSDDGPGADPAALAKSSGTGLRTLRQRLALDGASRPHFDIETAPNAGFRVRVTLAAVESGAGALH
jgi:signal transduction histidine kinase